MPAVRIKAALMSLFVGAAFVLAACGSSDDSSDSTAADSSTTSTAATGSGGDTVGLVDNSALGTQVLVDSEGRTLYLFEKDTSGDASTCSGACAESWPPLTSKGAATAGSGLDASQLTTLKRDDGTTQVAYNGHPLYHYAEDEAPGDTNGNDTDEFGAEWYAMNSTGATVEEEGSDESSSDDDSTSEDSTSDDSTSEDSSSGGYSSDY